MSSIPVSRKHGVNPSVVICARCGKDTGDLILPGQVNRYRCEYCKTDNVFLHRLREGCPKCKGENLTRLADDMEMPRQVSMGTLCEDCVKQREIVKEGGVYWQCKDCKSMGVIKPSAPLAGMVRKNMKIEPPAPCGIEFSKEEMCPVCGPHKDQYKEELDAQQGAQGGNAPDRGGEVTPL